MEAGGAQNLQPKNHFKHEKTAPPNGQNYVTNIFVEAQDPSQILTAVYGRRYYRVKSHFYGISTPNYSLTFGDRMSPTLSLTVVKGILVPVMYP